MRFLARKRHLAAPPLGIPLTVAVLPVIAAEGQIFEDSPVLFREVADLSVALGGGYGFSYVLASSFDGLAVIIPTYLGFGALTAGDRHGADTIQGTSGTAVVPDHHPRKG